MCPTSPYQPVNALHSANVVCLPLLIMWPGNHSSQPQLLPPGSEKYWNDLPTSARAKEQPNCSWKLISLGNISHPLNHIFSPTSPLHCLHTSPCPQLLFKFYVVTWTLFPKLPAYLADSGHCCCYRHIWVAAVQMCSAFRRQSATKTVFEQHPAQMCADRWSLPLATSTKTFLELRWHGRYSTHIRKSSYLWMQNCVFYSLIINLQAHRLLDLTVVSLSMVYCSWKYVQLIVTVADVSDLVVIECAVDPHFIPITCWLLVKFAFNPLNIWASHL